MSKQYCWGLIQKDVLFVKKESTFINILSQLIGKNACQLVKIKLAWNSGCLPTQKDKRRIEINK